CLNLPCATVVRKIEATDKKVKVERAIAEGFEQLELPLPAVLTVTSELFLPRYATLFTSMAAAEREVPVWKAEDLAADPSLAGVAGAHTKRLRLSLPVSEVKCQFVEGETIEERAENLAVALRTAKII
ncbi:MAG: electron transfer flavoprotein subunit beta/FixA family protein, partial [Dehalococcoidia bacterium]|nr:electron transfer flavoprotein subunit beta/FixA family protein [Dehalococcoidia bacterium]